MLSINSVTSTLSALMPVAPSKIYWASTEYRWIGHVNRAIDTTISAGVTGVTAEQGTAIFYGCTNAVARGMDWHIFRHSLELALSDDWKTTDGFLALTSGLNLLSGFDRTMAITLDGVAFGFGKYGAVTSGLMTCAKLASDIQQGDFLRATISAAKLSAIVSLGDNPAIEFVAGCADAVAAAVFRHSLAPLVLEDAVPVVLHNAMPLLPSPQG
ncbi:hypothetical protein [Bordetella tumulicola]|uniref:hypothetical protein n=1 Tax=Bordetella tumulicola TaxID=1649133 RepID=UPI0039EFC7F3